MRTTLLIDDDVLLAAKELALTQKTTAGQVLSSLARQALTHTKTPLSQAPRSGVPVLPSRGEILSQHRIADIMDEEGI